MEGFLHGKASQVFLHASIAVTGGGATGTIVENDNITKVIPNSTEYVDNSRKQRAVTFVVDERKNISDSFAHSRIKVFFYSYFLA